MVLRRLFTNLIVFSLLFGLSESAFCQSATTVRKGNLIISAGLSQPSALRMYLAREEAGKALRVSGLGPYLIKIDYFLSNKISIGLNGYYNHSDVHWMQDADDGYGAMKPFRHGVDVFEGSIAIRANYYFVRKNNWNLYGGLGAGLGHLEAETYTRAPEEKLHIYHKFPTPYHYEGTIGAKYFFYKNIGLYTELGIGQSWFIYDYYYVPASFAQIGLTLKI